jgi:4-hydroxybenzoate polyprenyltransferase
MSNLVARWMGYGAPGKEKYTFFERIVAFLDLSRPLLALMGPLLAASGAVLACEDFPPIDKFIFGFLTVLLATFGIHAFNDWSDRRRDLYCWPNRPIPTKRVKGFHALIFALLMFSIALFLALFIFNPLTFIILFLALTLGSFYSLFTRDKIGYLTLPPIIGLFPLGGWAAFSPNTLFESFTPWLLYFLALFWQAGHIMVYSPAHPIQKVKDKLKVEVPALFFVPTPKVAAAFGLLFLLLTWMASLLLYFIIPLKIIYLTLSSIGGLSAVIITILLLKDPLHKERSIRAFNTASCYAMVLFGSIVADRFVF